MIPRETVEQIVDAARIEEVVGEYVTLKKRGANMLGLCPFHNEKTPSFNVSPTKGIYKCFGCGEGGDAISFLMQHEHYTYPEALRFLAKKYNIEVEEEEMTPEMQQEQSERESLYIVSKFAEDFFVEQLHQSDEGKAIGLSYFRERGFSDEIIEHFKLGYSPDKWNTFTTAALDKGYQKEYLLKAGLTKERDGNLYDGYRGRVIFPIHNLSGRPIGFGGRTLKTDKKVPKYVNSPECDIYNKRKVLYGLYFAKKAIVKADQCLLVEGYTDVISLFQCGLENVVASSGTSLTVDQIRLISRYTKNITILFDGDPAGIKASFRGIDLILEEGLNVKVVLFPEGEDPDSFARKSDQEEMQEFLHKNAKDFLVFKTDLLLQDTEGDPIKKAQLIREIVESIARIPDFIARSVYVKECSNLLDVPEKALVSELNKIRRKNFNKANKEALPEPPPEEPEAPGEDPQKWKHADTSEHQEMGIIHLLLHHGNAMLEVEVLGEDGELEETEVKVSDFIVSELLRDQISMTDPLMQRVFDEYALAMEEEREITEKHFLHHEEEPLRKFCIDVISEKHTLHDWERKEIIVETEGMKLKKAVRGAIYSYKTKQIMRLIRENQEQLEAAYRNGEDFMPMLEKQKILDDIKRQLSEPLGRTVLR